MSGLSNKIIRDDAFLALVSLILVDQDGVIADYTGLLLERFQETHPRLYCPLREEIRSFRVKNSFPQEFRDKVQELCDEPGFYRDLPVIDGAVEALREMLDRGDEVFICTSPSLNNPTCMHDKYEWMLAHFGKEFLYRMIITKEKAIVRGNYLIDDRPKIPGRMTPTWQHILYDQPYNRDVDKPRLTWNNWKEILS